MSTEACAFDMTVTPAAPSPSAVVGRYLLGPALGRGGMSIVHVAHDPQLDRRVALKLLLPRREDGPVAQARLLREAQALAKLSHPNVVAVHDVGTTGERLFLAMELVVGRTLDDWMTAASWSWRQVLDAFVPAGEGLAAAHAVGLVHRDFKPANVMLGDDGRVRVLDFGLARAEQEPDPELEACVALAETGELGVLSAPLTRTGAVVGTPGYMAPEQWRGEPPDARTDQFSFCVSLWEALYGAPPFGRGPIPVLADRVLRGDVRPVASSDVPAWLERIVRQGLAVEPTERWPSMRALLDAIAGERTRERLRQCGCRPEGFGASVLRWVRQRLRGLVGVLRGRRARAGCEPGDERFVSKLQPQR